MTFGVPRTFVAKKHLAAFCLMAGANPEQHAPDSCRQLAEGYRGIDHSLHEGFADLQAATAEQLFSF